MRAQIDQAVSRRAGQRLLQLIAIEFEQRGDALWLAASREPEQAL